MSRPLQALDSRAHCAASVETKGFEKLSKGAGAVGPLFIPLPPLRTKCRGR